MIAKVHAYGLDMLSLKLMYSYLCNRKQRVKINDIYVMRCAIWCHLHNLKNVKNTHGGVLILVKLQPATSFFWFKILIFANHAEENTPPSYSAKKS